MAQDNSNGDDDILSFIEETLLSGAEDIPSFVNSNIEVEIPVDDINFRARFYDGPKTRAANFHNIPRGGNTNDIVSLTSEDPDAQQEYIQGIIVVSLVMALIYIIWGILLVLARASRIGEGKCCCNCCIKCVESMRAQGGCLSRGLCGWMAGRPPKRPTKASLKRDQSYKEHGIAQAVSNVAKNSASAVSKAAQNVVVVSSSSAAAKKTEGGGEDDIDKEPLEEQSPDLKKGSEEEEQQQQHDNEVEKVPSQDDGDAKLDEEEQLQKGSDGNDDGDGGDITVDDEYLSKRVKEAEWTMFWIRFFFLLSGLIVIGSSIALSVTGFHAVNRLLKTSQKSLQTIEGYFDEIVNECDQYLNKSSELDATTDAFLESILGEKQGGSSNGNNTASKVNNTALCPNANVDGIIDIEINLGQLFDGPLIKLAEVVDDVTGNVTSIEVVSFLDDSVLGAALQLDFDDLVQLVEELIPDDILSGIVDDGQIPSLPPVESNFSIPDLLPGNLSASPGNRMMQTGGGGGGDEGTFSVGGDLANFTIITNVSAYENLDLSALLQTNFSFQINFAEIADLINATLAEYGQDFLGDTFSELRSVAQEQADAIRGMDSQLDGILPYWYIAVAFASLLILFVVFMMAGCILAWMDKQPRIFRFANDAIILPLFIFIGIVTWIFTCVFLCLGIISGDLCVNTPDDQINGILENTLKDHSPFVYEFAAYYVNGCNPNQRPLVLDIIYFGLGETYKAVADFFNMMSNLDGPGLLGAACGTDMNLLRTISYLLSVRVDISINIMVTVGRAVLCQSFHPLYSILLYDVMCTDVIEIAGPMYFCLLLISIFSMIMVTLRVAWHEFEDDIGDQEEEKKRCCSGCGWGRKNEEVPEDLCLQEEDNQERAGVVHDDSVPASPPTSDVEDA